MIFLLLLQVKTLYLNRFLIFVQVKRQVIYFYMLFINFWNLALNYLFIFIIIFRPLLALNNQSVNQTRSVTKFSLKTGKMKSVNAILKRFYRLDCGLWIRRRAGCHSKLHKKNAKTRYNLQQHVFCTKTQCITFDKMTSDWVKKKRYYIDDPFEPYQVRNNFDWVPPYRPT